MCAGNNRNGICDDTEKEREEISERKEQERGKESSSKPTTETEDKKTDIQQTNKQVQSQPAEIVQDEDPEVRLVYLVPADKRVKQEVIIGMENTALDFQHYLNVQLNGRTIRLHDPIVEVYQTPHESSWYSQNNIDIGCSDFWCSSLHDAFRLTGGRFNDANNRWMYYIDADTKCGQVTGGNAGVTLFPANDVRGVGQIEEQVNTCDNSTHANDPICRWVGGLAHELGHSLLLPHPSGCEDSDGSTYCPHTIMWSGFYSYPDVPFTEEEKKILLDSEFVTSTQLPSRNNVCV